MNIFFKLFLSLILGVALMQAAGFDKEAKSKTLNIELSSQKSLTVGSNTVQMQIKDKSRALSDAKVSVKVFMPAMPGMPAMYSTTEAKEVGNGEYEVKLNFSMSGTWQIHIFISPASGKKMRVKTSVNL